LRTATEAALLFLLGMKRGFLCLHPRYQFYDRIKGELICNPGRHALVMLDLAVELDALVAHWNPARIVKRSSPYWLPDLKTIASKNCSLKNAEMKKRQWEPD
jgi:hypothetical protein